MRQENEWSGNPAGEWNPVPRADFARSFRSLYPTGEALTVPTSEHLGVVTHGTTIAALKCEDGIVMAGDRRATEGTTIANRHMEKLFEADRYSGVAIAGAAGPAIDMVRLFQVQLEHYEKVEGVTLSLEGKANQLAQMIRAHFSLALQGLVVIPLFGGWDVDRRIGRIFSYDVAGGRYEEVSYHATGSGGRDARATIKLGYRPGISRADAVELVAKALFEAAQEDAATGGPDLIRGIFPVVATIGEDGYRRVDDGTLGEIAARQEVAVRERSALQ